MEKFLLILREDPTRLNAGPLEERLANTAALLEWIQFLKDSGNYCSGAPLDVTERYGETGGGILGYDVILAENIYQAVSIAQTCPLVMNGIAVREVRPMLPLIR